MSIRHRNLPVVRGDAIGWDLPAGFLDDPEDVGGRAALAARYLAHVLGRTEIAAWIRRHRLGEHRSMFSLWAPDATVDALHRAVSSLDLAPSEEMTRALTAAQRAQAARLAADPLTALFRAVDEASWGTSSSRSLGEEHTLARITAGDLAAYVAGQVSQATVVAGGTSAPAAPAGERRWRSGVVAVDWPGRQCRMALRLRLAPGQDDPACASVLAELLDGVDGLAYQRLRTESGLVYGTGTAADERSVTLTLSALRERLPALANRLRRLLDEIDRGELGSEQLAMSAGRARHALLEKLDEPFSALDDQRQRLDRRPGLGAVADRTAQAARDLRERPRLAGRCGTAIGYVGPVDDGTRDMLEKLC